MHSIRVQRMSIWDEAQSLSVWLPLLSEMYCLENCVQEKAAFAYTLFSVIVGAIIYYLVLSIILWLKFPSDDLKLFSAIVVAIFLAIPYLKNKKKQQGAVTDE